MCASGGRTLGRLGCPFSSSAKDTDREWSFAVAVALSLPVAAEEGVRLIPPSSLSCLRFLATLSTRLCRVILVLTRNTLLLNLLGCSVGGSRPRFCVLPVILPTHSRARVRHSPAGAPADNDLRQLRGGPTSVLLSFSTPV